MYFPLIDTGRRLRVAPFALLSLLAIAGLPACGKAGQAGTIASCPPPAQPDGGALPYYQADEGSANGTVSGTGLEGAICYAGVQITMNPQSGRAVLAIDSTSPSSSAVVSLPANAVAAQLQGSFEIAPMAGVYKGSDTACGLLSFTYESPLVASCTAPDAGGNCETNCQFTYTCPSGSGYQGCCVPLATTYEYQAGSGKTCTSLPPSPTEGAWTLTITSVEAIDASSSYYGLTYAAHGSLSATLKGTADTTNTASVALSF